MAANYLHGVETIEIERGPRPGGALLEDEGEVLAAQALLLTALTSSRLQRSGEFHKVAPLIGREVDLLQESPPGQLAHASASLITRSPRDSGRGKVNPGSEHCAAHGKLAE